MTAAPARPEGFAFSTMFPLGEDTTPYRKLDIGGVSTIEVDGKRVLKVKPGDADRAGPRRLPRRLPPAAPGPPAAARQDPEGPRGQRE